MRFVPLMVLELISSAIGFMLFHQVLEALGVASCLSLVALIILMALRGVGGHLSMLAAWFIDPADALYLGVFPVPLWLVVVAGASVSFAFVSVVGVQGMSVLAKMGVVVSTLMLFVDLGSLRLSMKAKVR